MHGLRESLIFTVSWTVYGPSLLKMSPVQLRNKHKILSGPYQMNNNFTFIKHILLTYFDIFCPIENIMGLSLIVSRSRKANNIWYLSHIMLFTGRTPWFICESRFNQCVLCIYCCPLHSSHRYRHGQSD